MNNKVKILKREIVYQGHYQVERYQIKYKKYDGHWSEVITREVFERGNSVAVLLYDPSLDNIVLIEQFRIGAIAEINQQGSPWLLEIVAGVVESNESVEEVALRETAEEADLTFTKSVRIGEFYNSPGACTEKVTLFCAKIDSKKIVSNNKENKVTSYGLAEEHEDIRRILINFEQMLALLNSDQIKNVITVIALQWLQINHNNLKSKWLS